LMILEIYTERNIISGNVKLTFPIRIKYANEIDKPRSIKYIVHTGLWSIVN